MINLNGMEIFHGREIFHMIILFTYIWAQDEIHFRFKNQLYGNRKNQIDQAPITVYWRIAVTEMISPR